MAKSQHAVSEFREPKERFLAKVVATVEMEEIPPELILNWDQTGIKIVPSSTWTMEQQGTKRVDPVGAGDKGQIIAVFCGSLVGDFLSVQVIYAGKTAHGAIHTTSSHQVGISHIRRSTGPTKLPRSSTSNI